MTEAWLRAALDGLAAKLDKLSDDLHEMEGHVADAFRALEAEVRKLGEAVSREA